MQEELPRQEQYNGRSHIRTYKGKTICPSPFRVSMCAWGGGGGGQGITMLIRRTELDTEITGMIPLRPYDTFDPVVGLLVVILVLQHWGLHLNIPRSKRTVRAELSLYIPTDCSIIKKGEKDMHAAHSPVTKTTQL